MTRPLPYHHLSLSMYLDKIEAQFQAAATNATASIATTQNGLLFIPNSRPLIFCCSSASLAAAPPCYSSAPDRLAHCVARLYIITGSCPIYCQNIFQLVHRQTSCHNALFAALPRCFFLFRCVEFHIQPQFSCLNLRKIAKHLST